jgi:hypothetical protein
MFAPALVAVLPLSWAYLTATPTALPVLWIGQNLSAALSATLIPGNFPNCSHEPQFLNFTARSNKEGV